MNLKRIISCRTRSRPSLPLPPSLSSIHSPPQPSNLFPLADLLKIQGLFLPLFVMLDLRWNNIGGLGGNCILSLLANNRLGRAKKISTFQGICPLLSPPRAPSPPQPLKRKKNYNLSDNTEKGFEYKKFIQVMRSFFYIIF